MMRDLVDKNFQLGQLQSAYGDHEEYKKYRYLVNGKESTGIQDITFRKVGDDWLFFDID